MQQQRIAVYGALQASEQEIACMRLLLTLHVFCQIA